MASMSPVAGTNKIPLHHETLAYIERCNQLGFKSLETLTIEQSRQQFNKESLEMAGSCDFQGSIHNQTVHSSDVTGGIPIRIYVPKDKPPNPRIIVYFHGGCQILGSIKTYDVMCKTVVSRTLCVIVSVEYRLAPEHKLPAGLDDAEVVTKWVLDNRDKISGSSSSLVGVAGDSAGGQIAASVTHRIPGLAFQVLIYPMVDLTYSYPSIQEFPKGPCLTMPILQWALQQFENPSYAQNPRYSPILQKSFSDLPSALVILAQVDCFRDEGRAYAKKLKDSGVNVEVLELQGTLHGFFHLPGSFPEKTDAAYTKLKSFLNGLK